MKVLAMKNGTQPVSWLKSAEVSAQEDSIICIILDTPCDEFDFVHAVGIARGTDGVFAFPSGEEGYYEISFPDHEGWRVFSVTKGSSMLYVTLVKYDPEIEGDD